MAASMHILFGLLVGGVGLLKMAESPASGICALLLAGVLILKGIDQFGQADEQPADEQS